MAKPLSRVETLFSEYNLIWFSLLLKESGEFDAPDWDSYECVLPTTTECYDCTTTSKYRASQKNRLQMFDIKDL